MRPFSTNHRGPAIFLGLSLAGFAAACSSASATADTANGPLRCEIALSALPGGTQIGGTVLSPTPISGTYEMAITSRSSGGRATIRQSGDFTAPAHVRTPLGETELTGSPASHSVDLEIRVNGRRLTCADPSL
ncbi:curli-like amyloid fiber formation chaperone CsgH [Pararhodobacter zhoushanensis]|uniref:Curli-like amyloid fiber formation chaperone CsgH n=1 Tax=Pararhodobacter zhoushanensis TaxID=2479545 RepID=A0ABT3H0B5_9RHOB|nr:curli-like amyloid fiber formation chaperone CsgH [Pararhodobacter zhoushanensis]MCW1933234.1 curli-like amyloid fiber formation chaperone CsgH [Pararhodobacter zhoushanensis]